MPDMNMMRPDNHEAAMARADLYKLANYSFKLFKMIHDGQELEGWVQAKVTKAADYIASVYHFMEYEMKFSEYGNKLENSDVYSEAVRQEFKQKLNEAKEKLEKLKKKNEKDVKEGMAVPQNPDGATAPPKKDPKTGRYPKVTSGPNKGKEWSPQTPGPTNPAMKEATKAKKDYDGDGKVESPKDEVWGSRAKAAAKSGKTFKEDMKVGDTKKTRTGELTKTKTGVIHRRTDYSDDERGEAPSTVKQKSAAEKKADKSNDIKLPKHKGNTWGMKGGEKFGKKMETAIAGAPQKSGIPATAKTTVPGMRATQQDLKKANSSAALGEGKCNHTPKGKSCPVHGLKECGSMYEASHQEKTTMKHVKNPTKGEKQAAKDIKPGIAGYKDRIDMLKSAEKDGRLKERATGDYSAKKARAGKDIGKPGKNFAKIADKAGKSYGSKEKGEKVAGAVLAKLRKG